MSSKKHARSTSSTRAAVPPPAGPPWVLIGGVIVVAALGVVAFYPSASSSESSGAPSTPLATVSDTSMPASGAVPAADPATTPVEAVSTAPARQTPVPDADRPLPPLPVVPNMVPRPPNVVRDAYTFAARHPDILEFVPCFCGCETAGHEANADCFVQSRNADGSVRSWDTHGMACTVCVDVARDSMQMHALGASVHDIRTAIVSRHGSVSPFLTPTPSPPSQ